MLRANSSNAQKQINETGHTGDKRKPTKTKSKQKQKPKPEEDDRPRIFLLEVILDQMQLSYCTEFMNRCHRGPNCISFRFLDHKDPLTICENKAVAKECKEKKTGASSLFSLSPKESDKARKEFIIDFELFRDTVDGPLRLGTASLTITNLMKCVSAMCDTNEYRKALEREEMKRKPPCLPKPGPEVFTESIRQTVVLMAPPGGSCDEAALMSVYVRLTCFGPVMMTDCNLEGIGKDGLPEYVQCPTACTPRVSKN